jgi:hypothetical protein
MHHGSILKRDLFVIYIMNGSVESQVEMDLSGSKKQHCFFCALTPLACDAWCWTLLGGGGWRILPACWTWRDVR